MLQYIKASTRERWLLFLTIVLILSCLGVGYAGTQTVTDRIVIQAQSDLEKNWRYQYDILVTPQQDDGLRVLENGWVAPQSSMASYGGISMTDLETIEKIPGVEVAAPVALIGFINYDGMRANYIHAKPGHWYRISSETTAFDGYQTYILKNNSSIQENYDPSLEGSLLYQKMLEERGYPINVLPGATIRYPNEMLLVAIDPEAEDKLYNLSNSVISGSYLDEASIHYDGNAQMNIIPVIGLQDPQYEMNDRVIIQEFILPDEVEEGDLSAGTRSFFQRLTETPVAQLEISTLSSEYRFKNVNIDFDEAGNFSEEPYLQRYAPTEILRYSPLQYELLKSVQGEIPSIQAKTFQNSSPFYSNVDFPFYRYQSGKRETYDFTIDVIGLYDSSNIVPTFEESWEEGDPLDIYTPHHSMIIQNGLGEEIEPTSLLPLPVKASYYPGAPDMLTTLDALKHVYHDTPPLSSIRVVVEDVAERSEESQRKIEEVAYQINEQTGHKVEIMLGSGASKMHVQLAGDSADEVGVVEESWQQKGVSWSIENQIEKTNVLLFVYLLLISFIFCYTVITHSLLQRSSEFAILRAIGWTRRKIAQVLAFEIIGISLVPIAVVIITNMWLQSLVWYHFLWIWFIMIILISIGYLSGSRKSLKLSPRAGLEGEGTEWSFMRMFKINGLLSYVLHQLLRRPLRFGLLAMVLALTTFMSMLFVATQQSLSDFLFLSFLGETIDLNLKSYQTIFLIIGIVLTILTVFLLLFLNITERRKEFSIIRSIGWPMKRIQLYLSMEAFIVSALGSVLGTMGGYALLTFFSNLWLPIWMVALMIISPIILMVLFTWLIVKGMKMNAVVKGQHNA
ncbi:hypothetical protein GCM10008967_32130 [Bacillus carboniphilus]|uniref:ABC3 transporter permease C-terminal domain-containing protein n=1 Tax=Bacillus carboniphilus TaxID=86663 RepID=A0ABN0WK00_9BACI